VCCLRSPLPPTDKDMDMDKLGLGGAWLRLWESASGKIVFRCFFNGITTGNHKTREVHT